MRKPALADGARPIRIRAALEGDLPAVTDLLRAAQLPTAGLEEQFGAAYAVAEAGADR